MEAENHVFEQENHLQRLHNSQPVCKSYGHLKGMVYEKLYTWCFVPVFFMPIGGRLPDATRLFKLRLAQPSTVSHPTPGGNVAAMGLGNLGRFTQNDLGARGNGGFFGKPILETTKNKLPSKKLGSGFKCFLFALLCGEDFQFDYHMFQRVWNHQPEKIRGTSFFLWIWRDLMTMYTIHIDVY